MCGGAHPNEGTQHVVWDTRSGARLDQKFWIRGDGLPKRLQDRLLAKSPSAQADQSCRESLAENQSFNIYPAAKELMFLPDLNYATRNCADEVGLLYAEVKTFLTPAAIELLRAAGLIDTRK